MKVAYISNLPFADADFPLIREMQRQGVEVYYYIYVASYSRKATLVNIKDMYPEQGILPASVYEELAAYKDYMDMKNVYVVNSLHQSDFHPANIKMMLDLVKDIKRKGCDVVNITWPPRRNKMLLYLLRRKLVFTLHDPFPHSAKNNREFEFCRKLAFRWIPKIIMLNQKQIDLFHSTYKVPKERIFTSRLGEYDCIRYVNQVDIQVDKPFILFFGLIAPYKGVEFLLQAFEKVHQRFPDVKLLIAGSGKLYFDEALFKGKDYIEILNRYISMEELASLLKKTLFTVLPYKDATQSGVVQTAFSMGTPIVATDVGNFSEVIENDVNGKIVPPCDPELMAKAICGLLENPEQLKSMKRSLESVWQKNNDWSEIARQYLNCYEAKI
ncbi:MAG: glycosyltransferase family 4 protein [Fibrobacter sp.]|nr:glycosyltransferase family 4 protein [Fibrobacter sp.]